MEILGIDHIGVVTRDIASAVTFYTGLCGFEAAIVEDVPAMHMKICYVKKGNEVIELLEPEKKEGGAFGLKHIAFLCRDSDAVLELVRNKGFKLLHKEPVSHGNIRFFFCIAPDGEMVEFVERMKEVAHEA